MLIFQKIWQIAWKSDKCLAAIKGYNQQQWEECSFSFNCQRWLEYWSRLSEERKISQDHNALSKIVV